MQFIPTHIPEVILVKPKVFGDHRGFFFETYQENVFSEAGIPDNFIQDNHAGSNQGALRGLHYQIRFPQGKLVRVVIGEVFDVAVDIRRSSPTFGKWVGEMLSAENKHQLWVPPGFAHGYYVISKWAEVLYKVNNIYAPEYERTILWDDPAIGIEWPIIADSNPLLSEKDNLGKSLQEAEVYN
jgi:dTDP-4-dehydrorhamnose 3,5-epimerase